MTQNQSKALTNTFFLTTGLERALGLDDGSAAGRFWRGDDHTKHIRLAPLVDRSVFDAKNQKQLLVERDLEATTLQQLHKNIKNLYKGVGEDVSRESFSLPGSSK